MSASGDLYVWPCVFVCMHALCARAYWEYMLGLAAGGTGSMELQESHFTQPVGAGTIYCFRYQSEENPWMIHG